MAALIISFSIFAKTLNISEVVVTNMLVHKHANFKAKPYKSTVESA